MDLAAKNLSASKPRRGWGDDLQPTPAQLFSPSLGKTAAKESPIDNEHSHGTSLQECHKALLLTL
jgi:hypothetical protein